MRFLQSPAKIGAELQLKTDSTAVKVREIKSAQLSRMAAFDAEVDKLRASLDNLLNGSTPVNAIDLKALRAFLRKSCCTESASDAQPLSQTA